MIKLKFFKSFILLATLPLMALTCKPDDDIPFCYPKNIFYTWDSIYTQNLDNGGQTVFVSTSNTIPKAGYGIRLTFRKGPYVIPTVGADTCIWLSPTDTIEDIKIYTNYDFDGSHPAGSELSDYFRIASNEGVNNYSYSYFETIENFMSSHSKGFDRMDFLLFQAPQTGTGHQFRIDLLKNNGTILPVTVAPVTLN
jgi:hypothetical protein